MTREPNSIEPDFVAHAQLWSIDDVGQYLGIPVKTIYQWRTKGYGPPARLVGRHLRFKSNEVIAWFESQEVTCA